MEKLASDVDKEEKIWVKLIVSAHVLERIALVASTAHIRYGISIGEVRQRWEEIKNYRSDLLLSYNLIMVNSPPFQKDSSRGTMRIISWNCNMGFEKKRDAVMSLQPDIVVLQECSAKDIASTHAPFKHWVGSNKHKGMAIIGFANHEYTVDGLYTEEWPWFLPLRVDDVPLHILGLWACVKDQRMRYVRVMHKAVDHYVQFLSMPQVIIIGDFNSNSIWDTLYRERSHSGLVEKLERLGLVSVYHTLRGEVQGQEMIPTQFMYRNRAKSYHLDYAFVSKALSSSCELLIGEPSEWISKSDHMPLILTISL